MESLQCRIFVESSYIITQIIGCRRSHYSSQVHECVPLFSRRLARVEHLIDLGFRDSPGINVLARARRVDRQKRLTFVVERGRYRTLKEAIEHYQVLGSW